MAQQTSLEKAVAEARKIHTGQFLAVSRASGKYLEYVNKIQSEEIRNFTMRALENTNYNFWLCPASSSGKYHPNEDNNTSGTIRHLIKAAEMSIELCREFDVSTSGIENGEHIVLAATLLHDVCKNGYPDSWQEHTDSTHGLIAYNFLEQFELKEPEKDILRNAVRYHMGRWTKASNEETAGAIFLNKREVKRALNCSSIERIVQLSDYFASRNNISFMPGLDITKHRDYKRFY